MTSFCEQRRRAAEEYQRPQFAGCSAIVTVARFSQSLCASARDCILIIFLAILAPLRDATIYSVISHTKLILSMRSETTRAFQRFSAPFSAPLREITILIVFLASLAPLRDATIYSRY